jgi:hypothetical protein
MNAPIFSDDSRNSTRKVSRATADKSGVRAVPEGNRYRESSGISEPGGAGYSSLYRLYESGTDTFEYRYNRFTGEAIYRRPKKATPKAAKPKASVGNPATVRKNSVSAEKAFEIANSAVEKAVREYSGIPVAFREKFVRELTRKRGTEFVAEVIRRAN